MSDQLCICDPEEGMCQITGASINFGLIVFYRRHGGQRTERHCGPPRKNRSYWR